MGFYVTFDGFSGTGKGTLARWLEGYLRKAGSTVVTLHDNKLDSRFAEKGIVL